MPRGDRTGPWGAGAMTGRRAGYCAGNPVPGYANPAPGFRMGYGAGYGGRGWRHRFYATGVPGWAMYGALPVPPAPPASYAPPMTREAELESLKAQVEGLQSALQQANERISELDTQAEK